MEIRLNDIVKAAYEEMFRMCQFKRPDGRGWLEDGVTVSEAAVTVEPDGGGEPMAEMVSNVAPYDNTQVRYKLIGGTAGAKYLVRIRITTSDGQKLEARAALKVV